MFNLFVAGFCLAFVFVNASEKNWGEALLITFFTVVNLILAHLLINLNS